MAPGNLQRQHPVYIAKRSSASSNFTGPLADSTILYRINAAYSNAGSFRNLQYSENYMIAPSVSFIPSKKTALNVDLVYNANNSRIDRGQPIFGATFNTNIYATPISLAIGAPNDYYSVKNLQLSANNQRYWIAGYNYTRLFPSEPRNVMLNVSKLF